MTEENIRALQGGNEVAFKYFYDKYERLITLFARRLDTYEMDDIVVETFANLWAARHIMESDDHVRNFLYKSAFRIAQNKYNARIKMLSHLKEYSHYLESAEYFHDQITNRLYENLSPAASQFIQTWNAEINLLRPACKKVLLLSLQGLNKKEIAVQLNTSPKTVANLSSEAIRTLRNAIHPKGVLTLMLFEQCLRAFAFNN